MNKFTAYKQNDKVIFVSPKMNRFFEVSLEDEQVSNISRMHLTMPKTIGKKLSDNEQKDVFSKVKAYIKAKTLGYEYDGYQIMVCQSAAGYYVGCYCEDGPYDRLSGYSDYPEDAYIYMLEMYKADMEDADNDPATVSCPDEIE